MPKETGIIMSGSHPVDILEGRKTMTRRTWGLEFINKTPDTWRYVWNSLSQQHEFYDAYYSDAPPVIIKCPYGGVGDLLWVRETHTFTSWDFSTPYEDRFLVKYADGIEEWHKKDIVPKVPYHITLNKVRPSLFTPRWASRITREITQLGAERVQEITEEDCVKEGFPEEIRWKTKRAPWRIVWFSELWDSLNAKRGYSWEFNPWVWPIRFREI